MTTEEKEWRTISENPKKQKEQKPAEKQDYSGLTDLERAIHRCFLSAGVENVPVTIIKETANECKRIANENANAEWSEDDEQWLESIIREYEERLSVDKDHATVIQIKIDFLKSLRPVSKEPLQPHWKPSNEQIATLEKWLKDKQFDGASRYVYPIFESLSRI